MRKIGLIKMFKDRRVLQMKLENLINIDANVINEIELYNNMEIHAE